MILRWTHQSLLDIDGIYDHLAAVSLAAADSQHALIQTAIEGIIAFPARGRIGRVFGTRELVVLGTPYVVAYKVLDEQINILAIFHGAQLWPNEF